MSLCSLCSFCTLSRFAGDNYTAAPFPVTVRTMRLTHAVRNTIHSHTNIPLCVSLRLSASLCVFLFSLKFHTMRTTDEFWGWLEGPLLEAIHPQLDASSRALGPNEQQYVPRGCVVVVLWQRCVDDVWMC